MLYFFIAVAIIYVCYSVKVAADKERPATYSELLRAAKAIARSHGDESEWANSVTRDEEE